MSDGATYEASYPPKRDQTPDDPYGTHRQELDSPAAYAFPVTVGQGLLPVSIRGLYVGISGNVFCKMSGGNTTHNDANVFFYNVVAGTVLPVRLDGVFTYNVTEGNTSQNTTASFLVGLY